MYVTFWGDVVDGLSFPHARRCALTRGGFSDGADEPAGVGCDGCAFLLDQTLTCPVWARDFLLPFIFHDGPHLWDKRPHHAAGGLTVSAFVCGEWESSSEQRQDMFLVSSLNERFEELYLQVLPAGRILREELWGNAVRDVCGDSGWTC